MSTTTTISQTNRIDSVISPTNKVEASFSQTNRIDSSLAVRIFEPQLEIPDVANLMLLTNDDFLVLTGGEYVELTS